MIGGPILIEQNGGNRRASPSLGPAAGGLRRVLVPAVQRPCAGSDLRPPAPRRLTGERGAHGQISVEGSGSNAHRAWPWSVDFSVPERRGSLTSSSDLDQPGASAADRQMTVGDVQLGLLTDVVSPS